MAFSQPVTIFAKHSILEVWQGSEHVYESLKSINRRYPCQSSHLIIKRKLSRVGKNNCIFEKLTAY